MIVTIPYFSLKLNVPLVTFSPREERRERERLSEFVANESGIYAV
jgi:cobalamin biosynthesis protein CbiG